MGQIHKAGALIFRDKKLLIVKPKEKTYFISPGGKYGPGESAEDCLKRELKEELSVDLATFNHYKTYDIKKAAHSDDTLLLEFYIVEVLGHLKPCLEIECLEWLSRADFFNKKFNLAPSYDICVPDFIEDGLL